MRKKVLSIFLALVMVLCLVPMTVLAEGEENSWNIADGDISVTATAGGQTVTQGSKSLTAENPVITGSSDQYALTVTTESNATANITLFDLVIHKTIHTTGSGDVIIELDGTNQTTNLQKSNSGKLTINDDNSVEGSFKATGLYYCAGIGGADKESGNNITITGGTIIAISGGMGAGIGGGRAGSGNNITVTGGTVTANGNTGAGIGGGQDGSGNNITITGGIVRAVGSNGAGIGGGSSINQSAVSGSNITITGGVVTAIGSRGAAGIGGGGGSINSTFSNTKNGSNINITGGVVTAIGSAGGAGIGGGAYYKWSSFDISGGYGKNITVSGNAQVKVCGSAAGNGRVAAGIGNGAGGVSSTDENEGKETGDFSGLTEGGFVEYYASGADISTVAASYVRHYGNTERHEGDITVTEAVAATCTTTGNTLGINCSAAGEHCSTVLASEIVNTLPHSYKTEWTTDDTSHWHECLECGAKTDEAKHTDTETKDHICDVCGIVLGKCADNLTYVPRKEATAAEAGNTEYWQCDVCNKCFSDENAENEIKLKDTVIAKLAPSIIKGDGQTVTEGDKKTLEFTSDAAFEDFISVEVDGKTIDESNYTVKSGSTVVTLNADYVATLSAGEHTLGIVSQSGTATAKFTVNEKVAETTTPTTTDNTKSPQTGDNSNIFLWLALLFVSGGTTAAMFVGRKKRRAE